MTYTKKEENIYFLNDKVIAQSLTEDGVNLIPSLSLTISEFDKVNKRIDSTNSDLSSLSSEFKDISNSLQEQITSNDTDISILNEKLDNEISRATSIEDQLSSAISGEVERAKEAEGVLTTNLSDEISRATSIEDQLSSAISGEVERAISKENEIIENLTLSVENLSTVDNQLDEKINTTISNLSSTVDANYVSLSGDTMTGSLTIDGSLIVNRSQITLGKNSIPRTGSFIWNGIADQSYEAVLSDAGTFNINPKDNIKGFYIGQKSLDEILNNSLNETSVALNTIINNETNRAKEAEEAEKTRAEAKEAELKTSIETEISRAKEAEGVLTTNLANEISRALSAEAAEKTRAEAKEAELTTAIETEKTNRISEDKKLNTRIDDVLATGYLISNDFDFKYLKDDKSIVLSAGSNVLSIDTTDFIKDGMISNVELKKIDDIQTLIITFNTDSGKEKLELDVNNLVDIYTADGNGINVDNNHQFHLDFNVVAKKENLDLSVSNITSNLTLSVDNINKQFNTNNLRFERIELSVGDNADDINSLTNDLKTTNDELDSLTIVVNDHEAQNAKMRQDLTEYNEKLLQAQEAASAATARVHSLETYHYYRNEQLAGEKTYLNNMHLSSASLSVDKKIDAENIYVKNDFTTLNLSSNNGVIKNLTGIDAEITNIKSSNLTSDIISADKIESNYLSTYELVSDNSAISNLNNINLSSNNGIIKSLDVDNLTVDNVVISDHSFNEVVTEILSTNTDNQIATAKAIYTAINNEEKRAISVEQTLDKKINDEIDRALSAEDNLAKLIQSEKERAEKAEDDLAIAIEAEKSRAEAKEKEISESLTLSVTTLTNADTQLNTKITDEYDRAKEAEGVLTTNLANEIARALSAEGDLSTSIDNKIKIIDGDDTTTAISADSLTIHKISQNKYEMLVSQNEINSTDLYVISSDYLDGFGEQVKNIADGTDDTDAVSYSQLKALINRITQLEAKVAILESYHTTT